jgi:hypothetical protein
LRAQPAPRCGRIVSGPNSSKAKTRSGNSVVTCSIRASFACAFGSLVSFHVFVRWKVMPCLWRNSRSRYRPTCTRRRPRLWAR